MLRIQGALTVLFICIIHILHAWQRSVNVFRLCILCCASCCLVYSCVLFPAEIQRMKNAVPKNDKKKRKQMTEEIAKLEADLNQKHEEELRKVASDAKVNVVFCDL